MTQKEAYKVAEKLAWVDHAPQWVLRKVNQPELYTVLSLADPEDVVAYLWVVENHIEPNSFDNPGHGWHRRIEAVTPWYAAPEIECEGSQIW